MQRACSSMKGSDFFNWFALSIIITNSFTRIVHYKTAYTPPAPFEFVVLNNTLIAQQHSDFTLQVKTRGNVIPENVAIKIGEEVYYLQSVRPGLFEYTFSKVTKANIIDFGKDNSSTGEAGKSKLFGGMKIKGPANTK